MAWREFFQDLAGGLSGVVMILVCAGIGVAIVGEFRNRYGRRKP